MKPLVSILCATYNHELFIADTLNALLAQQTDFDFEIIVHDDASNDSTVDIVRTYEAKYPGVFQNIYQSHNILSADITAVSKIMFRAARGEYIAICEGDDIWTDPFKLQKQVEFLNANKDFVIHCGHASMIDVHGNELRNKIHDSQSDGDCVLELKDFIEDSKIVTCTAVFRNVLHDFPDEFKKAKALDWMIWVSLLQKTGGKVFYSKDNLSSYRVHSGGIFSQLKGGEYYKFYIKALAVIRRILTSPELQSISDLKRNWYLEQLFRCELAEGNKWKALRLLPDMLYHGYPFRSAVSLLSEWKKGRQHVAVSELSD